MIIATADFHININNRPDDTIKSLDQIATLANQNELLIILGDIYESRCPKPVEMNIFRDFIKKIKSQIEIIIGNHDTNLEASTLDEFYKFKLPNVTLHKAPYIFEYKKLKLYCDHASIEGAKLGPADLVLNLKEMIPIKQLIDKVKADFYLFGHIHKAQVVNTTPPFLYAGSIERVSFAERNEDKYIVKIDSETKKYGFKKLEIRPMYQIDIDLNNQIANVLAINIKDAIVKIVIKGTKEQIEKYNEANLKESLKTSLTYKIVHDIVKESKSRNTNINEGKSITECFKEFSKQNNFDEYTTNKGLEVLKNEH